MSARRSPLFIRRAVACLAFAATLFGMPSMSAATSGEPVAIATDAPTEVTHSGAIFNGTWRHSGCCNIAVFAVSSSPTFEGPVYDYTSAYTPGRTLIIRMQIGGLGESHSGAVSFDARSWTPDGTPLLAPETAYYVRFGVQRGPDDLDCLWSLACYSWAETVSFATRAARPPAAVTGVAGAIDDVSALVSGEVTAHDGATSAAVEYSTSSDLASPTSTSPTLVPVATTSVPVSWRLTGLAPATTYFFRVVATSPWGVARGEVGSFTTTAAVGISLDGGASITTSRHVKVLVVAPVGATAVTLSADGGFSGARTFPVGSEIIWSFEDLGDAVLTRTVYARFSGPGVDSSRVYSDDIIHDGRGISVASLGGRRVTASSLARLAGISTARSARIRLSVSPTSARRCRVTGSIVSAIRAGDCRLTVTVTPARGRPVSRTLTVALGR